MEVAKKQGLELKVAAQARIVAISPMFAEVVQKVLAFLSRSAGTGAISTIPIYYAPIIHSTDAMAPKMDESLGIDVFTYSMLGLVMTSTKYELLINF